MKRIRAEHKYKRRGIKGIYGFSFWDDTLLNAMKKPIRLLKRVLKK